MRALSWFTTGWGAAGLIAVGCAEGTPVDPPDPSGGGRSNASSTASGGGGGAGGALADLGASCDEAAACESGFCVDGLCCENACDRLCELCVAGGRCDPHPAGSDPDGECLGATCDGAKACDYASPRWSFGFGDLVEDAAADVAVAPNGDVVAVGSFYGTIDFGGGPLVSKSEQDIFIVKLDAMGNYQWSKSFGDVDPNPPGLQTAQRPFAVTIDPATGHIFMTGAFARDISFGGSTLTAQALDMFVVELDGNGEHVDSKAFRASVQNLTYRQGLDIAVDGSGNILLTGRFTGDVNFDGTIVDDPGAASQPSTFLAKLDSNLTTLWATTFGSALSVDEGRAVVASVNNEVVVCGLTRGDMTFGSTAFTAAGQSDAWLARLDANGNILWAKRFGGAGADDCRDLVALSSGDVAMVGAFEAEVSFGGPELESLGEADGYLARIDDAGDEVWSRGMRGPGPDVAARVQLGPDETLLVAGSFSDTLSTGAEFLTSMGARDIFVARFVESTGAPVWARGWGGMFDDTPPLGLAVDPAGDFVLTGTYGSELSLGGSALTSAGVTDVYLARFGP